MALQQAQAQAQAAAQALLAGGTAQAGNARNPFWNMAGLGGGPPPMLGGGLQGGLPANFYPQMVAFAAAQENATAMVAVAKLGPSKASPATNSSLVVRGSVRKFNMNGVPFSVAEWTRKTVEENLEWLVKLSKRHSGGDKAILLAYGDGCETLVLLDQHVNKMPADFGKIKKVGVGVTMANIDSTLDESKLANQGVLQPGDSIWEHLRFETLGDKKAEKCLFIHTNVTVWGEGVDGRKRVLQVTTGAGLSYKPNALFEQQALLKWKGQAPVIPPMAVVGASQQSDEEVENVTVIAFNPKELMLLEKAFDNRLTNRDTKTNVAKYTEEDKKAAQLVIQRAHNEFVMRGPSRKRKKKIDDPKDDSKKSKPEGTKPKAEPAKTKEPKASPAKKPKSSEQKPVKATPAKNIKKTKKDDDDDEPISKMVKKAEKAPAKKPAAPRRSSTGTSKETKTKDAPKKETRGRPKGTGSKTKEDTSPKKRSKSRSKK
mmetsp:Transcript_55091/g.154627  ORF Transcript_55091/g.154627 Transcript_55091/m.154627 type:complete len:486 (-) Transcript_55091:131-1588(-)